MDKFAYKGKAEIKHLNVRKEGPDDEKALAVDIKLQATTTADMLEFFHPGLKDVLFTDVGAVKNLMLKPIGFSNKVMNCDLDIFDRRFGGVEVGKFELNPKDGYQVTMSFSASIQPDGTDVAQLAEFVMDEVDISVQPQPELDFGAGEAARNLGKLAAEDGCVATISDGAGNVVATFGHDDLYDQALDVVLKNRRVSISLVQRDLRIGYNRAARLIEAMEVAGVVSAMQANGKREILRAGA